MLPEIERALDHTHKAITELQKARRQFILLGGQNVTAHYSSILQVLDTLETAILDGTRNARAA